MIRGNTLATIFLLFLIILSPLHFLEPVIADSQTNWKITSVKVCRAKNGVLVPSIEAIGSFPVYSFFIPRPVWTVNGNIVEAKPIYEQGRLVAFELFNASTVLEATVRNTVKFALPDQNGSRVFVFDPNKIPSGECYEFF